MYLVSLHNPETVILLNVTQMHILVDGLRGIMVKKMFAPSKSLSQIVQIKYILLFSWHV